MPYVYGNGEGSSLPVDNGHNLVIDVENEDVVDFGAGQAEDETVLDDDFLTQDVQPR
jgi:hypothetical protein